MTRFMISYPISHFYFPLTTMSAENYLKKQNKTKTKNSRSQVHGYSSCLGYYSHIFIVAEANCLFDRQQMRYHNF